MSYSDLQIDQIITAAFWFRCGRFGDDKDYAIVEGRITRLMDCYKRIQIEVIKTLSGRYPGQSVWVDYEKAVDISINK